MVARYRLTPEADLDLVGIWKYTCEAWGNQQANAYLLRLEQRFLDLTTHPALGRARDNLRPGYRSLHEGHHLIIYRHSGDDVEIVRVLHERMDVERRL